MLLEYQDLIGKPFKDLGRGPDFYDCLGLVIELNKRLGQIVPDYGVHYNDYDIIMGAYETARNDYMKISKKEKLIPGDIVVYKRLDSSIHLGVMVDSNHFIHATEDMGVQRNRIDHPIIRQLIEGIYRCKIHIQ